MTAPTLSITTLLSELTPEMEQYLHSIPGRDSELPENSYPAVELKESNVSIHRNATGPEDWVPLHHHNFYECIFCRQVPDMEYLIGTHRYRIHAGDVIFIPPGTPHRPIFPGNCSELFLRDELWVRPEYISSFGTRLPRELLSRRKTPYLFQMDSYWRAEVSGLWQKGVEENEKRHFRWDDAVEGYAQLLLVTMARGLLDESTRILQQERPNLFDRLMAYMEENLSNRITLEEAANRFFVSKSTVNRVFRKNMGTSFYQCLIQRRLMAAQHWILEGRSLEEVSVKAGFGDYATFYRAFRQAFGISPRQFKKKADREGASAAEC